MKKAAKLVLRNGITVSMEDFNLMDERDMSMIDALEKCRGPLGSKAIPDEILDEEETDEDLINAALIGDLSELLDTIPEGEGDIVEDDPAMSEEGSKGCGHSDRPIPWKEYPGKALIYELRKSELYIKSARDLKIYLTELTVMENKVLERIVNNLNAKYIHGSIYKGIIRECDFGGRNTGRLLYYVDTEPSAIYFGYVFKRSEMGHVSDELCQKVLESILKEKAIYMAELKQREKDERRKNRSK